MEVGPVEAGRAVADGQSGRSRRARSEEVEVPGSRAPLDAPVPAQRPVRSRRKERRHGSASGGLAQGRVRDVGPAVDRSHCVQTSALRPISRQRDPLRNPCSWSLTTLLPAARAPDAFGMAIQARIVVVRWRRRRHRRRPDIRLPVRLQVGIDAGRRLRPGRRAGARSQQRQQGDTKRHDGRTAPHPDHGTFPRQCRDGISASRKSRNTATRLDVRSSSGYTKYASMVGGLMSVRTRCSPGRSTSM